MVKKIVLIGAGGFGREVEDIMRIINKYSPSKVYEMIGFLDDDDKKFPAGMLINGYPVLGKKEWILEHKDEFLCNVTIGSPHTKARIQRELMAQGVRFETIKAIGGYVSQFAEVGSGCVFYGGVTVGVNSRIGDGVVLNQYVGIGHDAQVGDYTTVMPRTSISGYCKIGNEVNMGGHVFIMQNKKVGDNATVAPGSIVFSNVKAGTSVWGNPAKRIRAVEE